jgi:hypothetical protein
MSDETTPAPAFPLRDRIGAALTTACSEHSHCEQMGPAVWAVVKPELDRRDVEIKELREVVEFLKEAAGNQGRAWAARAAKAEATVARVKALAKDMRTWCSPHGIAVTYAQRIDEAIEPPERDHDALLIGSNSEAEFAAIICATMRKHRAEVHPEHAEGCGNCAVIKGAPEVLTYGLDQAKGAGSE